MARPVPRIASLSALFAALAALAFLTCDRPDRAVGPAPDAAKASASPGLCAPVAGWPADTLCLPSPADPARNPAAGELTGCWTLGFRGIEAAARMRHNGRGLAGSFRWKDGSEDSLTGVFEYPYLRFTAIGPAGNRRFQGNVLRSMTHFEVKMLDTPKLRVEKLIGDRVPCDST
jgi:hypothetical protein